MPEMKSFMRPRLLLLPLAAAIIFGLCEYKLSQTYERANTAVRSGLQPVRAPAFEGQAIDNTILRIERYVGRQSFFVVFFDANVGADNDANLKHLREHSDQLSKRGLIVIAVSSALPQTHRRLTFPKLFQFVTDLEPLWTAHRRWGCFDEEADAPKSAIFYVDRAGDTASRDGLPVPLENPLASIDRILKQP